MVRDVSHYQDAWHLGPVKVLTQTFTSILYETTTSSSQKAILKLLNDHGVHDESAGGALLQWYNGEGAIRVLQHDERASLLEYAPGPQLMDMAKGGREGDAAATGVILDIVKKLQAPRPEPVPKNLMPLPKRFDELYKRARIDTTGVFTQAAAMADNLLATQTIAIPLHGDLHHDNILNTLRGWLAIDPKGILGDPAYDVGNIFCNPQDVPAIVHDMDRMKTLADRFAGIGLDRQRVLGFAVVHGALSACWSLLEGRDENAAIRMKASTMAMELLRND